MRHYIAYRKAEDWGSLDHAGPEFSYWTARRSKFLENTLGQNIWVISGERVEGRMTFKLCHVFRPEKIVPSGAGHILKGNGKGLVPSADVTKENWFGKLLDGEGGISYGLNEIKDASVIEALLTFISAPSSSDFPDEVARPLMYFEGATIPVTVNAYERDPGARAACIAHYGVCCLVCGFDFEAQYGERGKGMIDVHHVKPLAEVGQGYQVDPIEDLRPVCPNCHTIIHRGNEQLSMAEASALVRMKYRKNG
jgi:HNH endonuclease